MKSKIKMPKMDQLLNDKNVLYIVFVIAILNLLGYLITNNLEAVVFFLIVGFLSTYFSKNMIIVLIIAMVSTSIFATTRQPKVIYSTQEGFKMMKKGKTNENTHATNVSATGRTDTDDTFKMMKKGKTNENTHATNVSATGHTDTDDTMDNMDSDNGEPTGEPQNQSKTKGKGNRIDYANTLEKAYENLQSTIGKEGIQGLTEQTAGLLNQQKELMDNINSMQPFLQTAEGFLKNLDFSGIENIGNMLNKFSGDKKQQSDNSQ